MQNQIRDVSNPKIGFFERVNLLFMFLIILWALTPYLLRNVRDIFVIFIFAGWWVSKIFIPRKENKLTFNNNSRIIPITLLWLVIVSVYVFMQFPNLAFGNYAYIILYYMPIFFLYDYLRYGSKANFRKIIIFAFLVALLNSIVNINILFENPYAAKEATGLYGIQDHSKTNVLTDIFIYAYVLTGYAAFIGMGVNKKLFIPFAIIIIIMIIQSTFFIALLSLFAILVSYMILKGKNEVNIVIRVLAFCIVFILIVAFKDDLFTSIKNWVSSVSDNYIITQRVNQICDAIIDFTFSGSLEARLKDAKISFETFNRYPFFGKGYLISNNILRTGIGMHSHLLDDLARFGIFGFFFEVMVYMSFKRFVSGMLDNPLKRYYNISWLGFVFYASFNPIVYPTAGIMMFLVFPMFMYLLQMKQCE